ncbi:MAG: hypothetical protein Tsb005_06010 [Gammaproteobacteria bacterium]
MEMKTLEQYYQYLVQSLVCIDEENELTNIGYFPQLQDVDGQYLLLSPACITQLPSSQMTYIEGDTLLHRVIIKNGHLSFQSKLIYRSDPAKDYLAQYIFFHSGIELLAQVLRHPWRAFSNILFHENLARALGLNESPNLTLFELAEKISCSADLVKPYVLSRSLQCESRLNAGFANFLSSHAIKQPTGNTLFASFNMLTKKLSIVAYHADGDNNYIRKVLNTCPSSNFTHDIRASKNYVATSPAPISLKWYKSIANQHERHGTCCLIRYTNNKNLPSYIKFETTPGFITHFANCYEEEEHIIIYAICSRFKEVITLLGKPFDGKSYSSKLAKFVISIKTARLLSQEIISDVDTNEYLIEFPSTTNLSLAQTKTGQAFTLLSHTRILSGIGYINYNSGIADIYERDVLFYQPQIVERPEHELIFSIGVSMEEKNSCFYVFDKNNVNKGPLQQITLPAKIHRAVHSYWQSN